MKRHDNNKQNVSEPGGAWWGQWLLLLSLCSLPATAGAQKAFAPAASPAPRIAIIIDDIGNNLSTGLRAVRLPGPVATAFLPRTRYARRLARVAHRHGKEVMLHLPMEAEDGAATGPGTITLNMTEPEFIGTLQADLANIPHVVGINNHMGSLLTRQPEHMQWLMQAIQRHGELFFVDSRTTAATVAQKVATENGVPNLRRDVFLDNDPTPTAIATQFERLLRLARQHGSAVAIGHPHETTLDFLQQQLPGLEAEGIQLVPVQNLLDHPATPERHHAARPAELASAIGSDPTQKSLATP